MDSDGETNTVTRLVGVYHADGTLWGEVSYWVGARLGRTHCSLCEITHGLFTVRSDWKSCRSAIPVAFETFHRNDQPEHVRVVIGASTPAVVAETSGGVVLLLGPAELEACGGSPEALVEALHRAVSERLLSWP